MGKVLARALPLCVKWHKMTVVVHRVVTRQSLAESP
jgi:hypothetical protein